MFDDLYGGVSSGVSSRTHFWTTHTETSEMSTMTTKTQVMAKVKAALEERDFAAFAKEVRRAVTKGLDDCWEEEVFEPYGRTIMEHAVATVGGEPFVEKLIEAGADVNYFHRRTGLCPIHFAAVYNPTPRMFQLLLKGKEKDDEDDEKKKRGADINAKSEDGLAAFHLLLRHHTDLGYQLFGNLADVLSSMLVLIEHGGLDVRFDEPISFLTDTEFAMYTKMSANRYHISPSLLRRMTALQLVCCMRPPCPYTEKDRLGEREAGILAEVVTAMLRQDDVNPNAPVAHSNGDAASISPLLLAAERALVGVVRALMRHPMTDLHAVGWRGGHVLHVTLEGGLARLQQLQKEEQDTHAECEKIEEMLGAILEDGNMALMGPIVDLEDNFHNSALHYAKQLPTADATRILLERGAGVGKNAKGVINVNPAYLEEYMSTACLRARRDNRSDNRGDFDVDDERYSVEIDYSLFVTGKEHMEDRDFVHFLYRRERERQENKGEKEEVTRVDTRMLEFFRELNSLSGLLDHPLVVSFLELQLTAGSSLPVLYFIVYFLYVVAICVYIAAEQGLMLLTLSVGDADLIRYITIGIACVCLLVLTGGRIAELFNDRKRIFPEPQAGHTDEKPSCLTKTKRAGATALSLVVYFGLLLQLAAVIVINAVPLNHALLQQHVAALTVLLIFYHLYGFLLRAFPLSTTTLLINLRMFTTVTRSYVRILTNYFCFMFAFAYCFFILFHADGPVYASLGLSLVKIYLDFIGDLNYEDLQITHFLGYVVVCLFVFLIMIVMLNVLNGLAVSDIQRVREEVELFRLRAVLDAIIHTSAGSVKDDGKALKKTRRVLLRPNAPPKYRRIAGVGVPGFTGCYATSVEDESFELFLRQETVGSIKETVGTSTTAAAAARTAESSLAIQRRMEQTVKKLREEELAPLKTQVGQMNEDLRRLLDKLSTIL